MDISDLKKLSFPSFISQFQVVGNVPHNITSMIGGKYYVPYEYGALFCLKYDKAISLNQKLYLQEMIPSKQTKLFIDVDSLDEETSTLLINKFEIVIKSKFYVNNLKVDILSNSLFPSKKHIYAKVENKNIVCSPFLLDYITFLVGSDKTRGLRLPGSLKKEGNSAGVYILPEGNKIINYSLQFHSSKHTTEIKPILEFYQELKEWYTKDEPQKLKKYQNRFNQFSISEDWSSDIEEKITWILEKILENNICMLEEYHSWWYIVQACKKLNYDPYKLDEICNRVPKYEGSTGVLSQYNHDVNYNYNLGTLVYYLSKEDKREFLIKYIPIDKGGKFLTADIIKDMYSDHQGLAKIFVSCYKDNIAITSHDKGYIYCWDEKISLWKNVDDDYVILQISNILSDYVQVQLDSIDLQLSNIEENKKDQLQTLKLKTQKILKNTRERPSCCHIYKFAKVEFINEDFLTCLNSEQYLLPIKGGKIVDLKTGSIRDRVKTDYFSFECNISVGNSNNPDVIKFFRDVMSDYDDRVEYFQRLLGYTLSGSTREKHFFVWWGDRDNGKSVIINMIDRILGNYSTVVSKEVFIKTKGGDRHDGACTPYLVPLVGSRCVYFSESRIDGILNDSLLKSLTGNDKVSCNPKNKAEFKFQPVCKLFLLTNHPPSFEGSDQALISRMHYIHFETKFVNNPDHTKLEKLKDTNFVENILKNHIDDVFAWMLEGSIKYWKDENLVVPKSLEKCKKDIVQSSDLIELFLLERTTRKEKSVTLVSKLYEAYKDWCFTSGHDCYNITIFSRNIVKKDIKKKRTENGFVFLQLYLQEKD